MSLRIFHFPFPFKKKKKILKDRVVRDIIQNTVLGDKEILCVPWIVYIVPILKALLPLKAQYHVAALISSAFDAMESLAPLGTGRRKSLLAQDGIGV